MMNLRLSKLCQRLESHKMAALLVAAPENVRYLSGFTGGDAMLLVTGKDALLLTDSRFTEQVRLEAPDWSHLLVEKTMVETIAAAVQSLRLDELGFEASALTYEQFMMVREQLPAVNLRPVSGWLEELRLVKDEAEIALMKEAGIITGAAFKSLLPEIVSGRSEESLAALLEFNMRRHGGGRPAFETIVGSGERGALPHGTASSRLLKRGDLVVMDFGATYQGYASDMTRTVCIGVCEGWQRQLYELVLEAQQRSLSAVRAGAATAEVDAVARDYLKQAGYGEYFTHGLGHGVGLQIHEQPRLSPKDHHILQEGMVVTVEPGLYLAGRGGVRIEDTVLVTAQGCEILTPVAKDLLVI